jgi:hypothetical protein
MRAWGDPQAGALLDTGRPLPQIYWKWLNRVVPATWVLYGLAGSQLADRSDVPLVFGSETTSVGAFMGSAFGMYSGFVPYTLLIMLGHILFVRVTSVLALRYLNFLRR